MLVRSWQRGAGMFLYALSFSAAIDVREYCTRLSNGVARPVGDWRLKQKKS